MWREFTGVELLSMTGHGSGAVSCLVVVEAVVMFHVKLWSCCFVVVTRVKAFVVVTRVKGFVFLHHGHIIILLSIIYCQE